MSSTSHRTAILLQLKTVLDSASVAVCATVCSVISVREQHSTKTWLFSEAREQKKCKELALSCVQFYWGAAAALTLPSARQGETAAACQLTGCRNRL